jgi:ribosomal protein S6--L-glutamate ligase
MLESRDGPLVLEVNSSPGLEGIEAASGVNVAGAVARHLDNRLVATRQQQRIEAEQASLEAPDVQHLTD